MFILDVYMIIKHRSTVDKYCFYGDIFMMITCDFVVIIVKCSAKALIAVLRVFLTMQVPVYLAE